LKPNIQALIDSIQRNVVPELPEELKEEEVSQNLSLLLARLVMADMAKKIELCTALKVDLDKLLGDLRMLVKYLQAADMSKFSEENAVKLMILGRDVSVTTSLCHMFHQTLMEVVDAIDNPL